MSRLNRRYRFSEMHDLSHVRLQSLEDKQRLQLRVTAERQAERRFAPSGLLIDLFMPPNRAEDVLYNLLGRYDYWVEKHGRRLALIIFFTQSIGSILTFWTDWMLRRVKLLKMFVSS